jgi:hypothetical protein
MTMPISKAHTTFKFVGRTKDSRIGLTEFHSNVVDHNYYAAALARKSREVKEFLAAIRNKPVAK